MLQQQRNQNRGVICKLGELRIGPRVVDENFGKAAIIEPANGRGVVRAGVRELENFACASVWKALANRRLAPFSCWFYIVAHFVALGPVALDKRRAFFLAGRAVEKMRITRRARLPKARVSRPARARSG